MDAVFKALADESRRAILDRLYIKGGQTLGELCEPFTKSMSRQAVMKHLGILEAANLVAIVWNGREKRPNPWPSALRRGIALPSSARVCKISTD